MKTFFSISFLTLLFYCASADTRLPRIFGDNMVLQRDKAIPVWGWASPGEKIKIEFGKQSRSVKADKNGKWMIRLDPVPAGGPYQLIVTGKNTITFNNVLVGEVWICSGQSNMEMPIEGWGKVKNYQQEIAAADYPQIRHFKVPNTVNANPQEDIPAGKLAEWKVCSPSTAGDFTAAGYFFARELYNKLHVPIGLLNTSWGGTMVETWISRGAFEKSDEFKKMIASMPALDLETIAKQKKEAMIEKLKSFGSSYEEHPANTGEWKNENFDDSNWPHMKLPGLWEQQHMGLDDLDGVVWFRKTVIISDEDAGKAAVIELAKIDDSDDSYVNGTKVGEMKNQYSEQRKYNIPAGVLKAGKNIIAVRVEDTGGGGGIYGDSSDMKLTVGNRVYSLSGDWLFKIESVSAGNTGVGPNSYPTLLFNAMVNPLIPYAIRGVIWYQGEANTGRAYEYRQAFPLLITDWRQHWGEGDFPFYFVQLASFNADNGNSEHGSGWAELREAQTRTLNLPNTGMAVTIDIGNASDIHPKDKQDVGKRLAFIALNHIYGYEIEYSGPVYQSMKTDSNKIILSFTHIVGGFVIKDKYGYIKGFEIAGNDQHFHYAKAYIDHDHIVVFSDSVADPIEVRYAWADDAGEANVFNSDGLPAGPFRTDQWKGLTEGVKYTITK